MFWLEPAEVKRIVRDRLPPHWGVSVTPKDKDGRRSAAYCADHYEIFAYPVTMNASLEPVAEVLRGLPDVSAVTLRTAEDVKQDTKVSPVRPGVYAIMPQSRLLAQ